MSVALMLCIAGADSPWILARHVRDRRIPFSAGDGYGTMKRRDTRTDSSTECHTGSSSSSSNNRHDSFSSSEHSASLFLPAAEARHVLPSVGDVWVPRDHFYCIFHGFFSRAFLVCSSTQKCSSKEMCAVLFSKMCSWQMDQDNLSPKSVNV